MLGFLRELLQRADTHDQPAFSRQEMDEEAGETLAAFVEVGVLRQPDTDGSDTWRIDSEALAAWLARSMGTECGSGVLVPARIWFLGFLRHYGRVREIFLARGLHWRDGQEVIRQTSRLLASACPVVLVLSELPPIRFWQHCWPAVGSIRELSDLQGCRLVVNHDLLFSLPRVPPRQTNGAAKSAGFLFPGLETVLTQTELDILRAVAAGPGRCMSLADVMAAGGYGKSATSGALRRLRERGLVAKPPGTCRRGDAITAAGAAFLDGNHDQSKL